MASRRKLLRASALALLVVVAAAATREAWAMARENSAYATTYIVNGRMPDGVRGRLANAYIRTKGWLYFRRLGSEINRQASTDRERVNHALEWTYLHVRPATWAGPGDLQWDDPFRTVKRGFGYCDQSAQVFCILAGKAGVRARLYFLRHADGESPHTVAQAWVDGEWILVDTLAGRVLAADDVPLTLERLRAHPALLDQAYEGVGHRLFVTADDFAHGDVPFGGHVPPWQQGPEVPLPRTQPQVDQPRSVLLYDDFLEAAMNADWARADLLYVQLQDAMLPQWLRWALGFHGTLAAYDQGEWRKAITRAESSLAAEPTTIWRPSLYELMGLAYERGGAIDAALRAYALADLPSTMLRARRLQDLARAD